MDVPYSTNKELFATNNGAFMDTLLTNIELEENETLRAMMTLAHDTAISYNGTGHIMTDDKAPVELLGMRQIDLIIKDEVSYYKEIYNTQGIQGLLKLL